MLQWVKIKRGGTPQPQEVVEGEQPIYTTKAHVFQIDPSTKKKWIPASSQAVNVSYYYDKSRNTYRIISVDGTNAVINSTITPNMNFTKTSQKFGQWSDSRAGTVYGLGFANEADCTNFVDKFKEVKELTKKTQPVSNNNTPTPKPPTPILTNSNQANGDIVPASETETSSVSSVSAAKRPSTPTMSSQISSDSHNAEKRNSNSSLSAASLPTGSLIDQLKYENDRLKIALAQSSANAKKWEVELQTLKNNNARLTTALQESTANVEEWKKQLSAYKEESARMKKKVIEMEKLGGSEASQKQMSELREQVEELETANSRKDQEITDLTKKVETAKLAQAETQRLQRRIQELEKQQEVQLRQVSDLRGELDIVQSSRTQDKLKLRQLQEQLSTKLKEVLSLSENMDQLSV